MLSLADLRRTLLDTLRGTAFVRATFGGTPRQPTPWRRAVVRRIGDHLHIERFDAKQAFAKTGHFAELQPWIDDAIAAQFSDVHLETATEATDIRISKKGKVFAVHSPREGIAPEAAHNRSKDVPLPQHAAHRLLGALGMAGRDGAVRPTHRDKFAQINEFLKHFDHARAGLDFESIGRPLRILDCGCGASALTLAMHFYLTTRCGLACEVLGVDTNESVLQKSAASAMALDAASVRFACQRIDTVTEPADIVLALHACDTATDAALATALRAEAKLILAVPCCHQNLNKQIHAEGDAEALRPILRHGILHERQADLVTDAFRALLLRIHGYRTDVVEFITREHTARNLMIRAVKIAPQDTAAFERDYERMKQFWQVTPALETMLREGATHGDS